MNFIKHLGMLAFGVAAITAVVPAFAQADLEGRQYAAVSAFDWDAQSERFRGTVEVTSDTAVEGFFELEEGSSSALGGRLLFGYRVFDWLGAELHVAGGGSKKISTDYARVDFTATFPEDFDFTPFIGLTPEEIVNLDPSVFEDVDLDLVEDTDPKRAKFKLNQVWGFFLRPNVTFAERFNVFGLVGYSYAKADLRTDVSWYTQTARGLSYGAGVDVAIIKNRLSVMADYVQYADGHELTVEATSLGLKLMF